MFNHLFSRFRRQPDNQLVNGLAIEIGSLSNIGRCRTSNQDSLGVVRFANNQNVLALLADGMGGYQGGEIASRTAVEVLPIQFFRHLKQRNVSEALRKGFMAANQEVYQQAQREPEFSGMGTTLVALVFIGRFAYYANTGDSRCYLIPNAGEIQQLSHDHTLVADLLAMGLLSPEMAANHPEKHVITSAIGTGGELKIAVSEQAISIAAGDIFILCSDGLYDQLSASEIQQIALNHSAQLACQQLVALANARGGHDNISVIILKATLPAMLAKSICITKVE